MMHLLTRAWFVVFAVAMVLLCFACPLADAHTITTGLGPACDAFAHAAFSPADVAVVVALTLLAAMRGQRQGLWLLTLLLGAWLIGGLTGILFPINVNLNLAIGVSLLVAGALVAADRLLPLLVVATLAVVIGGFYGFLTGAILAQAPSPWFELASTLAPLVVLASLVAWSVLSIRGFWARIAVRVLGSWTAATGLLMIGWSLRAGN
jgi:urease accessory protein